MTGLRDRLHNFWVDQGFVRLFFTNAAEIAPGVHRSNQPDARRLARMQAEGLRAVLYLRGSDGSPSFRAEQNACAALGLAFHSFNMSAHRLPPPARLLDLIALFRRMEKPFLLHCRAGADRTGLASAVYLLAVEGRSVAEAQEMLSLRFGHWSWSSTGVLDQMLHQFAVDQRASGIGFEDWLASGYDPAAITAAFDAMSLRERIAQTRINRKDA
ncbi:MAG: tyrosine-protein phosphatase [Rhodobacterales bacterium]|nr:tyrosine-protein phosphatase [Rhodobacterales bacterium]